MTEEFAGQRSLHHSSLPPLQDENGRWNKFGGRLAWDKSAICRNNPDYAGTGGQKTGEDYTAAPNIDHTQVTATSRCARFPPQGCPLMVLEVLEGGFRMCHSPREVYLSTGCLPWSSQFWKVDLGCATVPGRSTLVLRWKCMCVGL